jgi:hypothetical protein
MPTYPNLRARYANGTLKLNRQLRLPDGTEVRVSVTPLPRRTSRGLPARRRYLHPNRPVPLTHLERLAGAISLGGDALKDSEALYDGQ